LRGDKIPYKPDVKVLTRFCVMAVLLLACVGLEYYLHMVNGVVTVYSHVFYLPIIVAALWWGLKGSLPICLFLGAMHTLSYLSGFIEIAVERTVLFVLVGCILGFISDRHMVINTILSENEEKFKKIFEGASDGIIYLDNFGIILYINENALQFSGFSREEVVGKHFTKMEIFLARDLPEILKYFSGSFKRNKVIMEVTIQNKKGQNITLECSGTRLKEGGENAGIVVIARDVTERKRMEEALLESEENYRSLIGDIQDGVFVIQDERIQFANDAFTTIVGYSAKEAVGMKFQHFIAPEDLEMVIDRYRRRQAGEDVPKEYEFCMLHKDGKTRVNVNMSVGITTYKGRLATTGTIKDITESKLSEELLKKEEHEKEAILDSLSEQVTYQDRELKIIWANRAAAEFVGLLPEQIQGRLCYEIRHGRSTICTGCPVAKAMETGEFQEIEKKNPGDRFVHINAYPVHDKNGDVVGAVETTTDITDRKRMERQLRIAEKLRLENLSLDDANRLKTEFVAAMSHDLRTPLNSILGYSEILKDELYGELNEKQKQQLERIHVSGDTLLGLINDILDVSKIEAGKMELTMEELKVDDLVQYALADNEYAASRKLQHLDVDVKPGLTVWADELRVRQCLNNLLGNAVKFTPEGGRIRITAQKEDGFVELRVEDDGIGIPADKLDNIFRSFYRVETAARDAEGTGLGLTITKMLVELMGGKIRVESEEGRGSTFYFTLPTNPHEKIDGESAGIREKDET